MSQPKKAYDGDSAAPLVSFASSSLLVVALQIGGLLYLAELGRATVLMVALFLITLAVYVVSLFLIYSQGARRGDLGAMGRAATICGAAILLNFALLAAMYTTGPKPAEPVTAPGLVPSQAFSCTTTYTKDEDGNDTAAMTCLPLEAE